MSAVWVKRRVRPSRLRRFFRNRARSRREATTERSTGGTTGLVRWSSPPDLRAAEPRLHLALRGQEEHGQGGVPLVLAEVADEVVAADVGKQDVHEDEVGLEARAARSRTAWGPRTPRPRSRPTPGSPSGTRPARGSSSTERIRAALGLARFQEVLEAPHERLPVHRLLEVAVRAAVDGLDLVQEPAARAQDEHGHRLRRPAGRGADRSRRSPEPSRARRPRSGRREATGRAPARPPRARCR